MDVRGDLQAFDIKELSELLAKGDLFFEGNPFIGETLLSHPKLRKFKRLSMFVSRRAESSQGTAAGRLRIACH